MDAQQRNELRARVVERLENESSDNVIGLGTVFGMDRESLEAASPVQRVQQLLENIELEQLADILEIKLGTPAEPSPADLPPPQPESEILAAQAEPPDSAGAPSPFPQEEEATFAEDLTSALEQAAPVEPSPAPPPKEAAPVGEPPAEALPPEEPPAEESVFAAEPETQPPVEEPPASGPAEPASDIDSMAAEMLAAGELTPEELAALKAEAAGAARGVQEQAQPHEDEVDVLQQLRSVRKGTVRTREREKYERKRRREEAAKAAEPTPAEKLATFRIWLFRGTLLVFIGLVVLRSTVIIDLPDKLENLRFVVQIKLTGKVPEKAIAKFSGQPLKTGTPIAGGPATPRRPGGAQPVAAGPTRPLGPELTREFVERELRSGDLQGTIELASKSLDLSPEQVKKQLLATTKQQDSDLDRGIAQILLQDLPGAESIFKKLAGVPGPDQARATYLLGHVQRLQGRLAEAESSLGQAVTRDPKSSEALLDLAELARTRGNLDGAAGYARRAIAARPDELEAYYELGDILERLNKPADTRANYEQLLAKDPKQSYALFSLGMIEFTQSNFNAAAEKFKKAVEVNRAWRFADLGLAYNNLGICYDNLKKPADALKNYELAAQARPDDDLVQYNLARAYQRYEYPDKALKPYERAVDLMQLRDPSEVAERYARAVYNLAECYMRVHDFKLAAERYDEVLRLKPDAAPKVSEKLKRAMEAWEEAQRFQRDYGMRTVARSEDADADQPGVGGEAPRP